MDKYEHIFKRLRQLLWIFCLTWLAGKIYLAFFGIDSNHRNYMLMYYYITPVVIFFAMLLYDRIKKSRVGNAKGDQTEL